MLFCIEWCLRLPSETERAYLLQVYLDMGHAVLHMDLADFRQRGDISSKSLLGTCCDFDFFNFGV